MNLIMNILSSTPVIARRNKVRSSLRNEMSEIFKNPCKNTVPEGLQTAFFFFFLVTANE